MDVCGALCIVRQGCTFGRRLLFRAILCCCAGCRPCIVRQGCTFGRRLRLERIPPKLLPHYAAHLQENHT